MCSSVAADDTGVCGAVGSDPLDGDVSSLVQVSNSCKTLIFAATLFTIPKQQQYAASHCCARVAFPRPVNCKLHGKLLLELYFCAVRYSSVKDDIVGCQIIGTKQLKADTLSVDCQLLQFEISPK